MEPAAGLLVDEQPQQQRLAGGELEQAGEQKSVEIYCIYTANPSQLLENSTRWFKDGHQLSLDRARHLESQTKTGYPMLKIAQPNRHDAGHYECQVSNELGTSQRLPAGETCKLEVHFRPSVALQVRRLGGELLEPDGDLLVAGAALELVCTVLEARPERVDKFQWFAQPTRAPKADSSGAAPTERRLIGTTEANKLSLAPLTGDFEPSSFACVAQNSLGPSEPSNWINLELSRAPGKFELAL